MGMEERLGADRETLAEKWVDAILGSYPEETRRIWKTGGNTFANPVGETITRCVGEFIDHLIRWDDAEAMADSLDRLIRIRSVQEFSPSQALSFLFLFKKVLREAYFKEMEKKGELADLLRFEAKLDNMAMMAFDIYSKTREELFAMRVDEVKRAHRNIVRRANCVSDVTAGKAEE